MFPRTIPTTINCYSQMFASKTVVLRILRVLENITLFTFNFHVFSKLIFDKFVVKQINSWKNSKSSTLFLKFLSKTFKLK